MDPKIVFAVVLTAGAAVSPLAFIVTRNMPPLTRIALCSLALAANATPTIVSAHIPVIWPAIAVALITPFAAPYGLTYAALFGLLPIGVVWVLIAVIWYGVRTLYFARR
jgi:hypothetical protein